MSNHVITFILYLLVLSFNDCHCNGQIQYPLPLQCSEDTDCSLNSVCEGNQCRCCEGYVFSGNMTTCLKVAISYKDDCEEHQQCSSYLSVGGTCSSGKCTCSNGFHYLHGYCYKTANLGETCLSHDHCYVNYELKAAICHNNKCRCSDNFYQREYRSCRREAKNIGDECTINLDCRFNANTTCDKSNVCQLENSGTALNAEFNNLERTLEENFKVIGKPCNDTIDCNSIGSAVCSTFGVCICNRGHFLSGSGDECIAELGEPCRLNKTSEIKNAICREDGGIWGCPVSHVAINGNKKCMKVTKKYNSSCQFDEQCLVFGPDAFCSDRKCICNSKSHYVEKEMYCWINRGLGESCRQDEDCYIDGLNVRLHCNDEFVCSCPEGTHVSADASVCIKDHNELGGLCIRDEDCSIDRSICSNKSCICGDNYYKSDGTCLRGISASCQIDSDCNVDNSGCQNNTCTCNEGHIDESVKLCVPISSHGGECNFDIQCSEKNSNSICQSTAQQTEKKSKLFDDKVKNGTCVCADGYHYNYGNCFKKRVLKETCQNIGECYIESTLESVLCENGFCSCSFGWRAVNNTHCGSGATDIQIYNYTWVLLITLRVLFA